MAIYQGNKKLAYSCNVDNSVYAVPIGTILSYASATPPNGFLVCDGSEVSKSTYADLFEVIGDTYGKATDTSKFKLPDLRDKFVQGANGNLGTSKDAGLPNITGKFYHDTNAKAGLSGAFTYEGTGRQNLANDTPTNSGLITFDASKSNSIYGNSDTVQPPSVCLTYIIKALKVSDKYAEEVGVLIDDNATDATNKTWSAKKISSQISNGAIPQAEFNTNADINLNDYRNTGYWYFPDDLVYGDYKHTILNAPEASFVPPGGFGLDVRHYGSQYCTQILYVYNNGYAVPQTYQRCSFYTNNAFTWTAWKKVAFSA